MTKNTWYLPENLVKFKKVYLIYAIGKSSGFSPEGNSDFFKSKLKEVVSVFCVLKDYSYRVFNYPENYKVPISLKVGSPIPINKRALIFSMDGIGMVYDGTTLVLRCINDKEFYCCNDMGLGLLPANRAVSKLDVNKKLVIATLDGLVREV